jgi:Methyltransferase domain
MMRAMLASPSGPWAAGVLRRTLVVAALAGALKPAPAPAQDEVPFIATADHVTLAMLRIARVGPRDTVLDLGSGDGRIVITAAKRFGARGLGVELSPELVRRSRDNARRAGVADRVEFRVQDLFQTDLTQASVITMYLLPEVNLQLRPALLQLEPGTRIVSHDWDMGDWQPDRTLTLPVPDKPVGLEKKSRVHLWTVPARLAGRWCAEGAGLRLEQHHQQVQGEIEASGGAARALAGRVDGRTLHLGDGHGAAAQRLVLRLVDGRLQVRSAGAAHVGLARRVFTPAEGASCP